MSDKIAAGKDIRELAQHLTSLGFDTKDLTPELSFDHDGKLWFHYVDCRDSGYVYVGMVSSPYPNREAFQADWLEAWGRSAP